MEGLNLHQSPGSNIRVSQSQLQSLVQQEVQLAMNSSQTKKQRLSEVVKKLECDFDYGRRIKKLESRVNMLSRRVDVAIAAMLKKEKKSAPQSDSEDVVWIGPISGKDPAQSQIDDKSLISKDLINGVFQAMEVTKESLKRMREENGALVGDAQVEQPNLKCTPSVKGTQKEIKVEMDMQLITPKTEPEESQLDLHDSKSINTLQKDECLYPPLPDIPFPSVFSAEAISYSIPQKVSVHLALIKQPARLSVLWKVDEVVPEAPPMDSYRILMTMEKVKGSGIFWDWKVLHEVKAITLPMCVLIAKYKPGHKVCVAVVGKDVFGRFGPYSEVMNAVIPESN
ncbi:activating transcription factor 7-interacting protein 2 [Synchiropus splendidus]|uniref:activating transcription factor 7-interacting protein 2 n=1 Tax=Synchiropus splendidus TaxID=270530 RepID=UPI00237D8C39|nr:activating transcription factor 7-interacting protein 2 [Synchiropus splendidus]